MRRRRIVAGAELQDVGAVIAGAAGLAYTAAGGWHLVHLPADLDALVDADDRREAVA